MRDIPAEFSVEKLHPLTRTLLEKRGVVGEKAVYDFLFPSYENHIGDPFTIHGMNKAVERILLAMKQGEKIAVYSDYDCDGVPGGVLLREFFDEIGYPVEVYIPHRHNEGYGVHAHAIDVLKKKGVSLVITVDSGIANIDEVAYAKERGVDFIVTDHHLPITADAEVMRNDPTSPEGFAGRAQTDTEKKHVARKKKGGIKGKEGKEGHDAEGVVQVVPDAVAVINSKQDVCTYHDDMLCGCAVAWKLSCAILSTLRAEKIAQESFHESSNEKKETRKGEGEDTKKKEVYNKVLEKVTVLPDGFEKWMLDLVGISTIADMVPLVKENRALAHFGLKVLRKTKRPGLLHIFNEQRVKKEFLTEDDIAFTIAPRINAASRMGDPIQAHYMLYEKDRDAAEGYARDLEELNTQRKGEVKDIISTISFDHSVYQNDVVVVGDLSWGPGILGLIAQKIIDETGKPVFVWGFGSNQSTAEGVESGLENLGKDNREEESEKILVKGSCRSLGDISVVDLMTHVGKTSVGGVFEGYGGHEGAGGFSLLLENVDKLSDALNKSFNHIEKKEIEKQDIQADAIISIDDVSDVTYDAVAVLAPFGEGNRKPVFEIQDVEALTTKWFGKKGEHFEVVYATSKGGRTSLRGDASRGTVKAIQFFAPKDIEEKVKKKHSVAVHLERSYFGGRVEMRMRIVGVR